MLPKDLFKCIIKHTPLVSIDLIVTDGNSRALLGKRRNAPAKGYWFVPGGRIFKNETLNEALKRICKTELAISCNKHQAKFIGTYEHFYNENYFHTAFSTHYVVLAYRIVLSEYAIISPDKQHDTYQWFSMPELQKHSEVHPYTKAYFERVV